LSFFQRFARLSYKPTSSYSPTEPRAFSQVNVVTIPVLRTIA
jgi:hypothetical protein